MLLDIFSRIGHPKQMKNGYRIGRDATTVETGEWDATGGGGDRQGRGGQNVVSPLLRVLF